MLAHEKPAICGNFVRGGVEGDESPANGGILGWKGWVRRVRMTRRHPLDFRCSAYTRDYPLEGHHPRSKAQQRRCRATRAEALLIAPAGLQWPHTQCGCRLLDIAGLRWGRPPSTRIRTQTSTQTSSTPKHQKHRRILQNPPHTRAHTHGAQNPSPHPHSPVRVHARSGATRNTISTQHRVCAYTRVGEQHTA